MSIAMPTRFTILKLRFGVSCILVTCSVLWIVLLSVYSYTKAGSLSKTQSIALAIFFSAEFLTCIVVPAMAVLDLPSEKQSRRCSQIRFEITWISLLVVFHTSAALTFTLMSPYFPCSNDNPDLEGECRLVNVYISIASWLLPLFLFTYVSYFITICHLASKSFPGLWRTPARFCPWEDHVEATWKSATKSFESSSSQVRQGSFESSSSVKPPISIPLPLRPRSMEGFTRPASLRTPSASYLASPRSVGQSPRFSPLGPPRASFQNVNVPPSRTRASVPLHHLSIPHRQSQQPPMSVCPPPLRQSIEPYRTSHITPRSRQSLPAHLQNSVPHSLRPATGSTSSTLSFSVMR